ncbi:predicted transcriptional regulator [Firmicutes bacterium CAG:449]|nr:predicted transcriptional regulator [Firmicutes bacterium CAG:449]
MGFSYTRLWKLLIDKKLTKTDLHDLTGLSTSTINKLTNNGNVNTEVLEKICNALDCELKDIAEYKKDSEGQ